MKAYRVSRCRGLARHPAPGSLTLSVGTRIAWMQHSHLRSGHAPLAGHAARGPTSRAAVGRCPVHAHGVISMGRAISGFLPGREVRERAKIGQFQGESRFTTWAYKFVIFEMSAKISRHFGGTRACGWTPRTGSGCRTGSVSGPPRSRSGGICSPRCVAPWMRNSPPRQREVFVAIVVNQVPRDDRLRDHPPGSRPLDRSRDLKGEVPAGRHEDCAARPALACWTGRGRPRHHRPDGPGWRLFAVPAPSEAWSP